MSPLQLIKDYIKGATHMERYVSTVILSDDLKTAVCIRKNRPDHLAGKLNAVGGHIKAGESIYDAASREAFEETSLVIDKRTLTLIGNLSDANYTWDVAVFVATLNPLELAKARTATDEPVEVWPVLALLAEPSVDVDFKHMLYEAIRIESKRMLYDGSRGIKFTSTVRH
jgi:8-oxo-dGTP pyrophosphatase MutT (NUDIX family)